MAFFPHFLDTHSWGRKRVKPSALVGYVENFSVICVGVICVRLSFSCEGLMQRHLGGERSESRFPLKVKQLGHQNPSDDLFVYVQNRGCLLGSRFATRDLNSPPRGKAAKPQGGNVSAENAGCKGFIYSVLA